MKNPKCPECRRTLRKLSQNGEFECSNQNCALLYVRLEKNGDFSHFAYDEVLRNENSNAKK